MNVARRPAAKSVDGIMRDRLRMAESIATREFPEAQRVHAQPYRDIVVVEVWSEKGARVYGVHGEVL